MNKFFSWLVICALLLPRTSSATEAISFVADVQSEALAEEAILLVHCLSNRSGLSWEWSGEKKGRQWLELHEKEGVAVGSYHRDQSDKTVELKLNQADAVCAALEPAAKESGLASLAPLEKDPAPLALVSDDGQDSGHSKTWLWVGLGAAAIAGGFFLLRPKAAEHGSLLMR